MFNTQERTAQRLEAVSCGQRVPPIDEPFLCIGLARTPELVPCRELALLTQVLATRRRPVFLPRGGWWGVGLCGGLVDGGRGGRGAGAGAQEARAEKKWAEDADYQSYKASTPLMVLWPPRRR